MRFLMGVLLTVLTPVTAEAELVKSTAEGFITQHSATVAENIAAVFPEMTGKIGSWWNPDHSFSGDTANMRLDADCFCESWGNNLVQHLDTTIWIENQKVVMQGGLGPLKELGLSGTMTWSLTQGEDENTNIAWKYHVYGYSETKLAELAVAVDGVLKEQIGRLVSHLSAKEQATKPK